MARKASPKQVSTRSEHDPADLYPLIFDSIHEGVFTVDEKFHITSFNAAAERITGTSREKALGRRCYEVFRASICQGGCALRQTLETGQPVREARIDILDARMRSVPIEVSTAVLRHGGRLVGGVEIFRDVSDLVALRQELVGKHGFAEIIGDSPPMREIFRILPDVAEADASVLIEGPSGTGKELVARALHSLSSRKDKAFVQVNCAALPDALLESELFGYVRGAFTDAKRDKLGRFSLANKGTLFLDEIGDISGAFQAKLLRVLQDGEFTPLGATRSVRVDVRVVAATNRDLASMIRAGTFREDLYYRIRVVPICLPPLRERRSDIPLLVEHFVRKLAARTGKAIRELSPAAMEILYDHEYPGNIRELENALQRAFVLCHGHRIEAEHLPREWLGSEVSHVPAASRVGSKREKGSVRTLVSTRMDGISGASADDKDKLIAILDAHQWKRSAAARTLGIGRNTLWRKMKRFGMLPCR